MFYAFSLLQTPFPMRMAWHYQLTNFSNRRSLDILFGTWILGTNHFNFETTGWVVGWFGVGIMFFEHPHSSIHFFHYIGLCARMIFFSPSNTLHDFCGWGWKSRLSFINLKNTKNNLWTGILICKLKFWLTSIIRRRLWARFPRNGESQRRPQGFSLKKWGKALGTRLWWKLESPGYFVQLLSPVR